jgi:SAM-dependent methyltransferase
MPKVEAYSFRSHVVDADKPKIGALYRDNGARPTEGFGAKLDAWLQARQRRLILSAARFSAGQRVIDIGAGQGCMVRAARAAGAHVTAVDLVPELVAKLRTLADRAVQADLESLVDTQIYDRVLAIGVLDFVVDPVRALQRLAQLTAPGGRLLVLVPTLSLGGLFYRFEKWCRGVRVNIYRPAWCMDVLSAQGLTCVQRCRPLPSNVLMTFQKS